MNGVAEVRGRFTTEMVKQLTDAYASDAIEAGSFRNGSATDAKPGNAAPFSYAMWCGPPEFNDFVRKTVGALGYGPKNSFEF